GREGGARRWGISRPARRVRDRGGIPLAGEPGERGLLDPHTARGLRGRRSRSRQAGLSPWPPLSPARGVERPVGLRGPLRDHDAGPRVARNSTGRAYARGEARLPGLRLSAMLLSHLGGRGAALDGLARLERDGSRGSSLRRLGFEFRCKRRFDRLLVISTSNSSSCTPISFLQSLFPTLGA